MNVLISGAGIAGLTLALQLHRAGHQVTLVERSPSLRNEGYMIDFFGPGYAAAERMGLVELLRRIHYPIARVLFVDGSGREQAALSYPTFRRLLGGRHFNFMRGELEEVLFAQIKGAVPIRFSTTVKAMRRTALEARVLFSDDTVGTFDLVVGADGLHSAVRAIAFGEEARYERFLGYYTAAYVLDGTLPVQLPADVFWTLTVPGRQVAIYPIRGGRYATFFLYRDPRAREDFSFEAGCRALREAFAGLGWVVPRLLEACDPASFYFDAVTQIEMPRACKRRVVLVGDAFGCLSLLAGQGASMAMAGAFILAEELARRGNELTGALVAYQARLAPSVIRKQRAGRRIARWFLPDTRTRLAARNLFLRTANWPIVRPLLERAFAAEGLPDGPTHAQYQAAMATYRASGQEEQPGR